MKERSDIEKVIGILFVAGLMFLVGFVSLTELLEVFFN